MVLTDIQSEDRTEVAIIGAGPYGLSIAAHLGVHDIPFRIFGMAMSSWSEHMPTGMHLKSEGFASSLSHPHGEFTLKDYCASEGIAYKDVGLPVKLETFVDYGVAFQKRFVPNLEANLVIGLEQTDRGFQLLLDNQQSVIANNVIIAIGITNFARIPEILKGLPSGVVSHSWDHGDLEKFRGSRVAVIGAGASALDVATLLHEGGANVELIARSSTIRFHDPPVARQRSLKERITRPLTPIGIGLPLFFFVHQAALFRLLPERVRLDRVRKTLGPAPGWFVRDRIAGKVPFHLGVDITDASEQHGVVKLELRDASGNASTILADHVIAATGYSVDLDRIPFLSVAVRQRIRCTGGSPALSANFESSLRGLYFVGLAAANTFGPLLRFACGAEFVAGRLAKHLAKQMPRVAKIASPQNTKRLAQN